MTNTKIAGGSIIDHLFTSLVRVEKYHNTVNWEQVAKERLDKLKSLERQYAGCGKLSGIHESITNQKYGSRPG